MIACWGLKEIRTSDDLILQIHNIQLNPLGRTATQLLEQNTKMNRRSEIEKKKLKKIQ